MSFPDSIPVRDERRAVTGPILLIGAAGQLGTALAPRLARLHTVLRATRTDVDLEQPDDIRAIVQRVRPCLVVNAAAYTAVDDAEHDEARCARVNTMAPTVLAEETARLDVPLIHFSTNYVFDGSQRTPYDEDAPTSPPNVYGATKAAGEQGVAVANPRHLILRTAAVYACTGRNFMRRMLELAHERDELRVVDDQFVSPTPAWVLADAAVSAAARLLEGRESARGIFHVTTRGSTSWYGFAERILALDLERASQRVRAVLPVRSAEFPTPARRPANGVLDVQRFEREFDVRLPGWDDALQRTLGREQPCL